MFYVFDVPSYEYKGTSSVKIPNSTDVVPPEIKEHQCLIWNGSKWEVHPDFRGTKFYSNTGMFMGTYGCIGLIPDTMITKTPPKLRMGENIVWSRDNNDWYVYLDVGWIYDDNHVPRPMTPAERVYYHVDELPPDMKIDGDDVVPKTPYELYADGIITLEEANNKISKLREEQYILYTDKYGMMYMRGEVTLEFWEEEIQKIKDEYPYIEVVDG